MASLLGMRSSLRRDRTGTDLLADRRLELLASFEVRHVDRVQDVPKLSGAVGRPDFGVALTMTDGTLLDSVRKTRGYLGKGNARNVRAVAEFDRRSLGLLVGVVCHVE